MYVCMSLTFMICSENWGVCMYKLNFDIICYIILFRQQYGALKAECQKVAPAIGSGKFITTPIITKDGRPIQNPSTTDNLQDDNRATSTPSPFDSPKHDEEHVDDAVPDKKGIQWKLMLHQIGMHIVQSFI